MCSTRRQSSTHVQRIPALHKGGRGLHRHGSLAQLLAKHGRKPNHLDLPPLTLKRILAWADDHFARTGRWPTVKAGPIAAAPGETWGNVDNCLRRGLRGLTSGSSLLRLLVRKRDIRDTKKAPPLSVQEVASWARAHCERTGTLPHYKSGPVAEAPQETWAGIDLAIRRGRRGFSGGSSLAQLLNEPGLAK